MANRPRRKGQGSVYQRKSDGLWIGAISLGRDENGHYKKKTVSAHTEKEAWKKLRAQLRLIEDGLPPSNDRITVAQVLDEWLEIVLPRKVAPAALDNYRWAVRCHINPAIGSVRVSQLTPRDVDRLLTRKEAEGLATSSVRRIRSVLSAGLKQAKDWDLISRNVAEASTPPRLQHKEGRALTDQEARTFVSSLQENRLEALYLVILWLGLRRGEALGLKWTDLDTKKHTLTIRRALKREHGGLVLGAVKTPKSRRSLYVPDELWRALQEHKRLQAAERSKAEENWREAGLMFTTEIGTPIDPRNFYRDFVKACERAKIGKLHPHELRHSAATLMLAAGVPIEVVSEVLGHSSIRITADTYAHIGSSQRREASEAMTRVLTGPVIRKDRRRARGARKRS
jgi:integrase